MTTSRRLRFDNGRTAESVRVADSSDAGDALVALGLVEPRPVAVVVGGAGGLDDRDTERLQALFSEGVVPSAIRHGAATVDGGTASGVMRLLGMAHHAAGAATALIGVAAIGTVVVPGEPPPSDDAAPLEQHHTHFVLVPGHQWGAEAPWIADVATALADGMPSLTVLVNGGEIAYDDAARSIAAQRPVLTVAGSGRAADQLAAALDGDAADPRAGRLVASGLVHAAPVDDPAAVGDALEAVLAPR